MKKLNLAVAFILTIPLITFFSNSGIASKDIQMVENSEGSLLISKAQSLKVIERPGYMTGNNVNVRNIGSMKGKVIGKLNKGNRIYAYEEKDGWYSVEYANNKKGWVSSKYVEFRDDAPLKAPDLNKIEKNGYVTVNNLNIRYLGSMKGKVVGNLNRGAKIYIFGEKDGWFYVEYSQNKRGWISSKYVDYSKDTPPYSPGLNEIEKPGYVTVNNLNVRHIGSMKGKVVANLNKGVPVYVYGEKDGWYYIDFVEHGEGWVSSKYIQFKSL